MKVEKSEEKGEKQEPVSRAIVLKVQKSLINNPQKGIASMYSDGVLSVNNGYNTVKIQYSEKSDENTEVLMTNIFIRDAIAFYVKNLNIPTKE